MPILTICQRGNVRSVTLAVILKDFCGLADVAPVGIETTTPEGMAGLMNWADQAFVAGTVSGAIELHADYPGKVIILDSIGQDVYGKAMHPVLVRKCMEALRPLGILNGDHPFYPTEEIYLRAVDAVYGRA